MKKQYAWFDNVLTPEECDLVISYCSPIVAPAMYDKRNKKGELVMPFVPNLVRKTQVAWIAPGSDVGHLMQKVINVLLKNAKDFFYLPCSYVETIQFAKYGFLGHYSRHSDSASYGRSARRIISASVQLSDPDTYRGGDLKININNKMLRTPRKRGTLTLFPSVFDHQVTPVWRGERCSLVLWSHIAEPPSEQEIAAETRKEISLTHQSADEK